MENNQRRICYISKYNGKQTRQASHRGRYSGASAADAVAGEAPVAGERERQWPARRLWPEIRQFLNYMDNIQHKICYTDTGKDLAQGKEWRTINEDMLRQ
jgi:hypothetical protein